MKSSAQTLVRWDKQFLWHPFTQHAEWDRRDPLIIESGKGVWLRDVHGRRYIDGVSSLWVNVFGHRRPELDRAIRRQLRKIAHSTFLGLTHEPAIRLAKELISIAPKGLSRVFFSDNGSTSVEVALKMAYQYRQLIGQPRKKAFVAMREGYHGDTLGSVSVGGMDLFHRRFRHLLFKTTAVVPGDFEQIERILKKRHGEIAAVVMESLVQGASGMRLIPRGYLRHVATLCRRLDVSLIVDEVATGFGRTGKMFAVEHEGVSPDFLCVAKSLTGGYLPLAATLTQEKIFRAFVGRYEEFKAFFHGHTYTANPLACAVALETLRLYRSTRLLANVQARAAQLATSLSVLKHHPHVKEVRQVGLMVGIELVAQRTPERPFLVSRQMGLKLCDAALRHGLWIRPLGDVIVLMPPLAINQPETQHLLNALLSAFKDVFNLSTD